MRHAAPTAALLLTYCLALAPPVARAATVLAPEEAPSPESPPTVAPSERLDQLGRELLDLRRRIGESQRRLGVLAIQLGKRPGGRPTRIVHHNRMGAAFVPVRITYALDGREVLSRSDARGLVAPGGELPVFEGALAPGNHVLSVTIVYRGHDAVFRYLDGYALTARGSHTFVVGDSTTRVTVDGSPRGNAFTTDLTERPGLEFHVVLDAPWDAATPAQQSQ